ncbi:hypothetical protein PISMIDRAFT_16842 [Pisolithus microcarpus 441]|uniref:Uncharacterized protein n=1 Tax=Pisolithus microcarpus 441 TaxID=765257 RepID=A0A0C9Z4W3_9AGAM|nr:hypothetical protein PISMIDRAFT_16842 [Pisolithus microcarpus 441]
MSRGFLGDPSMLKVFLTPMQKVSAEELTTCDRFSLGILDTVILNLGVDRFHHLVAESSIHIAPVILIDSLLINELETRLLPQTIPASGETPPPTPEEEPEGAHAAQMSEEAARKRTDEDVKEFLAVRNLEAADTYLKALTEGHRF